MTGLRVGLGVRDAEGGVRAEVSKHWLRLALATAALVVASLVAAAIHGAVVPEHMMELAEGNVAGWLPLAFACSAVAGLGFAWAVAALGPTRMLLGFGFVFNLVMLLVGLASRTVGLPGSGVEAPTPAWLAAVACEALAVLLCGWLLAARVIAPWRLRVRPAVAVVGLLGAVVLALVLVGPSDVIEHGRMLAAWMWSPRAVAGWMWFAQPDAWMW